MFGWFKSIARRKRPDAPASPGLFARMRAMVRAKYDNAQTNDENRRHWANADGLSANAANSLAVRSTIRNRARYERDNSPYCNGMVDTFANDVIGRGPMLQVAMDHSPSAKRLEREFRRWASEVNLPEKLRCMLKARVVDGEAFAIFTTNPELTHNVKLDVALVECDRVTTPDLLMSEPGKVDGIEFDQHGNPTSYHILKNHPGEGFSQDYDTLDARYVIHLFKMDRAGQCRGVSQLQPSLGLFAILRRFTRAVLLAAEWVASICGFIQTDAPAGDQTNDIDPLDQVDVERNTMLALPAGWKASQIKAEQPTTAYPDFQRRIVSEAARPLHMPYNIAAADSAAYNYASGRLDHKTYFNAIAVERSDVERKVLERIFAVWHAEASRMSEFLPQPARVTEIEHEWMWQTGDEHVDPVKDRTADEIALRNKTTTRAAICAKSGQDWEAVLEQLAKEQRKVEELGLVTVAAPSDEHDPATDDEVDDDEE